MLAALLERAGGLAAGDIELTPKWERQQACRTCLLNVFLMYNPGMRVTRQQNALQVAVQ